jgi:hypothetical protein
VQVSVVAGFEQEGGKKEEKIKIFLSSRLPVDLSGQIRR